MILKETTILHVRKNRGLGKFQQYIAMSFITTAFDICLDEEKIFLLFYCHFK